jgi:hypothetical protein
MQRGAGDDGWIRPGRAVHQRSGGRRRASVGPGAQFAREREVDGSQHADAGSAGGTNVPNSPMLAHMAQEWCDRSARYRSSDASSRSPPACASGATMGAVASDAGENCSACTLPNVNTKWIASAVSAAMRTDGYVGESTSWDLSVNHSRPNDEQVKADRRFRQPDMK